MFERLFQWALKQGPRLLFAVALLVLLGGLIQAVNVVVPLLPSGRGDRSTGMFYIARFWAGLSIQWPLVLEYISGALWSAMFPLFGALIIHRLDRWRDK